MQLFLSSSASFQFEHVIVDVMNTSVNADEPYSSLLRLGEVGVKFHHNGAIVLECFRKSAKVKISIPAEFGYHVLKGISANFIPSLVQTQYTCRRSPLQQEFFGYCTSYFSCKARTFISCLWLFVARISPFKCRILCFVYFFTSAFL